MEKFFQIGSDLDEVEIKDLLLKRYSNIEYVLSMDCSDFLDLLKVAIDKDKEEEMKAQWRIHLPYMSIGYLKYIPFSQYKDQITGANIDMRPKEEIIKEIEELHNRKEE